MRAFLKQVLASFLALVLLLGLLGGGLAALAGVAIAKAAHDSGPPEVEANSVLVWDLSTVISDSGPGDPDWSDLLQGDFSEPLELLNATQALRRAATDSRIRALELRGGDELGIGPAARSELRRALAVFRESGKPIVAWDSDWDQGEYDLAVLARRLLIAPGGSLILNGLGTELPYFADALEKLGVEVQVTRVGAYKSAVEPFIRSSMSAAEREQLQALLDDRWRSLVGNYAEGRGLEPTQVEQLAAETGLFTATDAQTARLVDAQVYEDDLDGDLHNLLKLPADRDLSEIDLADYADAVVPDLQKRSKRQIAVLYASGAIRDGSDDSEAGISATELVPQINDLADEESVKAVVLRLDSPGGGATASEAILRALRQLQKQKPLVVSMGDTAASGGYWISSYANRIFAEANTITGSIGVFGAYPNIAGLGDRLGINFEPVRTGPRADLFSLTRPRSETELKILQRGVDQVYDDFLERVSQGRKLDRAQVQAIAQGRVWTGRQALDRGLVDELGGLEQAIRSAAKLARLGDDWQLRRDSREPRWQRLLDKLLGTGTQVRLPRELRTLSRELGMPLDLLTQRGDRRGIYARLPYEGLDRV